LREHNKRDGGSAEVLRVTPESVKTREKSLHSHLVVSFGADFLATSVKALPMIQNVDVRGFLFQNRKHMIVHGAKE
jgi:hypothetical protein